MIYESTIIYTDNNDKSKKESYVLDAMSTFTEVEAKLHEEFNGFKSFDVIAIKRSKIAEIANARSSETERLWVAELMYEFLDDDAEVEKTIKYKILFFSETFDSAKTYISEYSKQGYELSLVSLKMTNFTDVIQ